MKNTKKFNKSLIYLLISNQQQFKKGWKDLLTTGTGRFPAPKNWYGIWGTNG